MNTDKHKGLTRLHPCASVAQIGLFTALLAYRLPLPIEIVTLTAIMLPWLELLCGLLLVANYRTPAALMASAIPGISRSSTRWVISGVRSPGVSPVPPVVTTTS